MTRDIEIEEHQLSVLSVGGVVTIKRPMKEPPAFVMGGQPYSLLPSFSTGADLAACRMRWPLGEKGAVVKARSVDRFQEARVIDARVMDCMGPVWLVALEGV